MEITGIYADMVYVAVVLFGMFAHWMKQRAKNQADNILKHVSENFWKTTFPALLAAVVGYFGMVQLAPEVYYPVSKFALLNMLLWGYTSDSLLNGEIQKKE
jgi:hypothetical protein